MLRIPVESVRYWRHVGKGPKSFKVGRRVLYAAEDVEVFIASARKSAELTWDDELELARQADEERGYDLPRDVRSKRMHDHTGPTKRSST